MLWGHNVMGAQCYGTQLCEKVQVGSTSCFDGQVILSYFKLFDSAAFKGDAATIMQPSEKFIIYRVKPSLPII